MPLNRVRRQLGHVLHPGPANHESATADASTAVIGGARQNRSGMLVLIGTIKTCENWEERGCMNKLSDGSPKYFTYP